jgi:hypothetical protein
MPPDELPTISALIERTLDVHAGLGVLGETISDEWQYVTDLGVVWRGRLQSVAAARGSEPAPEGLVAAIDAIAAEAASIEDPHQAIDWLSTVPQVVLLALGEAP